MPNAPVARFRPARPDDVAAAVPLILSSGPETFDYVFRAGSRSPADFLLRAFADGAGQFGYRNHVVGEVDGRVVAAGAGWTSARTVPFLLAALGQFARFIGPAGTPAVVLRGLRTETVIRPPGRGEFYIGHLGVDPAHRGQGIGAALVQHLLVVARDSGAGAAVLDVAVTNPRAKHLYESLGFRVTAERASTLRRADGFVPPHRRMARAP